MAKEWEATNECGNEEEISFEMTKQNACCPLECEFPLKWGLLCCHWMYAAFVDDSPIPLSLIYPCWFLDSPDYLEKPWVMSYFLDPAFAYLSLHGNTTQPRSTPTMDSFQEMSLPKYKRHAGDQYQNNGQNMMLNSAFQVVEKQKEFTSSAAEEFASAFTGQTAKLVEVVKAREERQKAMLPQLPAPLKEPKIRRFLNKNGASRKMTGTEAAVAAKADKLRANRRAAKELQIREKYEAELAALNAEYSSPPLRSLSSSQLDTPLDHDIPQPQPEIPRSYTPIQMIFSDSDWGQESHHSGNSYSIQDYSAQPEKSSQDFSPTPRQSGRSRKPTKKIESQQRRKAEEESKPKRRKIRKSKVDVTSQLKELLGLDIDFST